MEQVSSLTSTGNPNNLDGFVSRMPFAEYATDAPVSQYVENGDNVVSLQMNTQHGRLISSFQLDDDIQYNNPSNNNLPMYKLVVNRGMSQLMLLVFQELCLIGMMLTLLEVLHKLLT